jgi:hypothetical protein
MELEYILVLETRFYRFESCIGHLVLLAQWNRAVGYEPMCREFESLRGRLTTCHIYGMIVLWSRVYRL